MQLSFVRAFNSITSDVAVQPVADFVVLSGPNGSGKSNLLGAIQAGQMLVDGQPPASPTADVRLFQLAQLVAQAEGPQSPAAYRDRHVQLFEQIRNLRSQFEQPPNNNPIEVVEANIRSTLVSQRQITENAVQRLLASTGRERLIDIDVDQIRQYGPLLTGIRDPFTLSVTELFLSYHDRRNRNRYAQWLATQDTESGVTPLSDEEFAAVYGPAPWQLLDETLQLIGLDYTFVPPIGIEENLMYAAELVHLGTQTQIKPEHLSSGEKTLLAVALSLYSGARLGEAIELPRVLLLDEADASLHPAMVRSLLQVVGGIFCERYGVKVIMTTHSPTTVALAPEESLYVMQRNQQPRLRKASRDEALSSLTVGIPTLSVTTENRRQVFVESEYDESCYQHLFRLLHAELATPFSLAFIASGKGGHGDAEAVKRLVQELRGSGNLSVWGVVDRDSRGGAPEGIVFNPDRYAIENLVLDPLAVGIFLLRRGQLKPEDLGLDASLRHFQFGATEAQTLSDAIVAQVRESSDDASIKTVHYLGGFSTAQPMFWSETNGHDLEDRLCASYPALRADGKNLKSRVITEALADVPCYIPVEVVTLFQRLLAAAN